jgi:peptide/nickel transport system substrate-binding protein
LHPGDSRSRRSTWRTSTRGSFLPRNPGNTNVAGFCDRRIDRDITHALELQTSDLGAANDLWARIDRAVVDRAPWLFLANPKTTVFVSERVGNYQYNPQWGVLLDQLWVR